MPGNSIEIPVSLGLQSVQSQVEKLREVLKNSVKLDSSTFKDIERFLDKIANQATGLKGKMDDAFKTSTASKQFLKQYEQLFGMLDSAKTKLTSLGLKDIAFSTEDSAQVTEIINKIKTLQTEITSLEKGKIGKIFDDSSIENADKIKEFVASLGKDLNELTFSGLSALISKELTSVNDNIEKTEARIANLKTQMNSLSGGALDNLTAKMQQAIQGATDKDKSTFKTEKILEYRKALEDFYATYEQYSGKRGEKNDTTGSVATWMKKEAESIANGIQEMKDQFHQYEQALDQLEQIRKSGIKGTEAKEQINDVAKMLGLDFDANNYRQYNTAATALKDMIEQLKGEFKSEADFTDLGRKMLEDLTHVFDHIDLNQVINVGQAKAQLQAIFKEIGIDVSDSAITQIFNSLSKNMDMGTFLSTAMSQLDAYKEKKKQIVQEEEESNERLKQSKEKLESMSGTVTTQESLKDDTIKQKQQDIESLTSTLQSFIDKVNTANGTHFRIVDDGAIKKGQSALEQYIQSLSNLENKQKALSNIKMAITRWMGFYQVLNLAKRAINDMKRHVQELDTVMTKIAVVTNMSQSDLWGQIGQYSEIARQYGVAIKGVYEVSQLYYQQGLNKGDVMGLTQETLKMARIAGLDYATAADYMTTAIRGFKLEMSDAAHVTDVFSNLAAHTASSTEELAVAISKTAASAASVNSSFEATSAMMATMIATTRESATNIGTALKSIISRYGEMKAKPQGTDSEGEEYSLNKVDTALQSIGISIHDVNGQFRDFDDVVLELAEAWDGIDKNTQRYIATVMAGNRQQSRFLALVSNVEEYKRALALANDSENSGELQTLKTLDSVDAKLEQMKVTVQEFYTSSGIQDLYKGILDTITNVISAANDLPKVLGNIPATAIAVGLQIVSAVKNIALLAIAYIQSGIESIKQSGKNAFAALPAQAGESGRNAGRQFVENFKAQMNTLKGQSGFGGTFLGRILQTDAGKMIGMAASTLLSAGSAALSVSALNAYGASKSTMEDRFAGASMFGAAGMQGLSGFLSGTIMSGSPIVGALSGIASALPSIISAIQMNNVNLAREIELSTKNLNEAKQKESQAKGYEKDLQSAYDKLKELEASSYKSTDAMSEYTEYMNQLAESYPELVSAITEAGNATIELSALEQALAAARLETADATISALEEELKNKELQKKNYESLANFNGSGFTPDNLYKLTMKTTRGINQGDIEKNSLNTLQHYNNWARQTGQGRVFQLDYGLAGALKDPAQAFNILFDEANAGWFEAYYKAKEKEFRSSIPANSDDWTSEEAQMAEVLNAVSTDTLKERYISTLKQFKEAAAKAGKEVSYNTLTGRQINDLDKDIKSLNEEELASAIENTQKIGKDYVEAYNQNIENIEGLLSDSKLNKQLQLKINNSQKNSQKDYSKYKSFIANIVTRKYGNNINWEDSINNKILQSNYDYWTQWLDTNEKQADYLINQFSPKSFVDENEVKNALQKYGNLSEDDINQKSLIDSYVTDTITSLKDARERVATIIKQTISPDGVENAGQLLQIKEDLGLYFLSDNFLTTDLWDTFGTQWETINSLQKQGYTVAANNFQSGLVNLYKEIGKLDSDKQTSLLPMIKELDLQDTDNLDAAIETLTSMEGMGGLVQALKSARDKILTNVTAQAAQYAEKAKEVTKAIEQAYGNMNKAQSYSSIVESAQKILSNTKNKELTFDNLIRYDDDLKSFVLTEDAIREQLIQAQAEFKNNIQNLKDNADNEKAFLEAIDYSKPFEKQNELTDAELSAVGLSIKDREDKTDEYLAWLDKKEVSISSATNYSEGIEQWKKDQKENIDKITNHDIALLSSIQKNSAINQLASFDWESIAGGSANETVTKEQLKLLLEQAGGDISKVDELYNAALNGNIEAMNTVLEGTGYQISSQQGKAIIESNVKQYTTALDELMNQPVESWSKETINLLKGLGKIDQDNKFKEGITLQDTISTLRTKIGTMINGTTYTLEQYNQDIMKIEQQSGFGQEKAGIDLLSGGFSLTDLSSYLQSFGLQEKIDDYFDFTSKTFKKDINGIDFNDVVKYDELTNTFKIDTSKTFEEVKLSIMNGFHVTEEKAKELYLDAQNNSIQEAINTLDRNDIGKQAASTLSTIASAKAGTRVDVSKLPQELQSQLGANAEHIAEITSEYQRDSWILGLNANEISDREWRNAVIESQRQIKQNRTQSTALQGIISQTVDREQFRSYLQNVEGYTRADQVSDEIIDAMAEKRGYMWDEYTQSYRATAEAIDTINNDIQKAIDSGASEETIIELRKQAGDLKQLLEHDNKRDALSNLLANYQDAEMYISDFQSQFNIDLEAAGAIKIKDGKKIIDIDKLDELIDGYDDLFKSVIEQRADEYIENASKAGQLITQGTNSQVEMSAFKEAYSKLTGSQTVDFFYDSVLKALTFDASKLRTYFEKAAEKLNLGDQTSQWVEDQIDAIITENLDFSSYLSGTISKKDNSILRRNLENYVKTHLDKFNPEDIANSEDFVKEQVDDTLSLLSVGGQVAINALKSIKSDLTTEEIEAAYRTQVAPIIAVQDTLADLQQGSVVATNQIDILTKAGFTVNADGVVTVVGDLVTAYQSIYDQMQATGEATISELNSSYAKLLTSQEQGDIDAIAAMGDAMGMTYDTLGQILGKSGVKLEEWINNAENQSMFERIGAGKIRITDFTKFAAQQGWQPGSEEYTSAFKAYNDSLIEYNKKTEQSITDEVKGLKDIKGGEQLNLTELYTKLQSQIESHFEYFGDKSYGSRIIDKNPLAEVQQKLVQYGADLSKGILTLSKDANLIGIAQTLKAAAETAGSEMTSELQDMLTEVIKAYVDAITKGIEGGMTNVEAEDLKNKAASMGVTDLRFEQTTEGLKLAQESAIKLYQTIKKIDAMQATLVFDGLRKSLEENNEHYQSMSSTMARIAEINNALGTEPVSDARRQQYKAELELAQEIALVRATSEDNSMNFMSNKLPAAQENPLNYYKNWSQAFSALKNAKREKAYSHNDHKWHRDLIDYQDWYNIVNEMNNLAALGEPIETGAGILDGSLESAAALIQKGADALIQADSGELKVSLRDIGIDFETGSGEMSSGIETGIKNMANSQVHILDGLIALLEAIVAMESLGDIDTDNNGIDLSEMFSVHYDSEKGYNVIDEFSKEYEDWRQTLEDKIDEYELDNTKNTELVEALKGISIRFGDENFSLADLIKFNKDDFNKHGGLAEVYTSLVNAMVQAAKSGNYDLNNIAASVQQEFSQAGLFNEPLTVDVGSTTILFTDNGQITFDWATKSAKDILKRRGARTEKEIEQRRQELLKAAEDYYTGKQIGQIDLEDILLLKHRVKIVKAKKTGEETEGVEFGGKTYNKIDDPDMYEKMLYAAGLAEKTGLSDKEITIDGDTATAIIKKTSKINVRVKTQLTGDNAGKTIYEIDDPDNPGSVISGSSENDVYNKYLERFQKTDENGKTTYELDGKTVDKNIILHEKLGVRYSIATSIEKDGVQIDQNSAEGQDLIRKALNTNLEETLQKGPDGNYFVQLDENTKINLDASQVEIGEEPNIDAAKNALLKALGLDTALQETITNAITDALQNLPELFKTLAEGPSEGAGDAWAGVFDAITSGAEAATEAVQALIDLLTQLNGGKPLGGSAPGEDNNGGDNTGGENGTNNKAEQEKNRIHQERVDKLITTPEGAQTEAQTPTVTANVEADTTNAETAIESLNPNITANVTLNPIDTAITTLLSQGYQTNVKLNPVGGGEGGNGPARGTIGLAHSKGTLMGELGPELVVSKGRYFVVGQSGPEMVDLADDAIVFNHIQTRSLLERGTSSTRGHAITNEYTAASYVKGNVHGGPAMSSASAALAALKQLRAQWAALANLSAQDLAGAGGGGGGGGNKDAAFIKELERWYNLLQEIAKLEKKITRETALQSKIKSTQYKNGKQYFNSQARTLKDLEAEIAAQTKLNTQQQIYFNKRRKELNESSPFSSLYTFDENGQLKYKEGAFEKLSKIMGRDESGKPNMSVKEQYKAILKLNPKFAEYMKYDSSGKKIEYENGKPKDDAAYQAAVQAFWDKIEADKQEMQSLYDSINETGDKILELQQQQNEILQEMKDNQMAVENAVLDAIVDAAQREIDELQDTRDAIEDSNSEFINGLRDALNKERQMYEDQQSQDDLNSKLRKLAILQASGGPASEIASLQKEVDAAQRDMYFDKQQEQIDAIQEASDKQIEKLDKQIELMQDTLDYEKAHGLLWKEVAEIMKGSPAEIAAFIHTNNSEYWDDSPVASAQALQETLFQAQQWESFRDMTDTELKAIIEALGGEVEDAESQWNKFDKAMKEKYGDAWTNSANREKYKETFLNKYNETGNYTDASNAVLDSSEFTDENMVTDDDKKEKKWGLKQAKSGQWSVIEASKKYKHKKRTYEGAEKQAEANNKIWEKYGKPKKGKAATSGKYKGKKPKYKYDVGGIVSEEGLGYLHAKEAVLTASQTKILRNDLLGNNRNSLATLLTDFRDAYQNLQTGDKVINTNNGGVNIGNASVNMNVSKIANDYDAQRAGEQALNKMMEIARKTKAQNRIGG